MTHYVIAVGTGEQKDHTSLPYRMLQGHLKAGDTYTYLDYPASIGPANSTPDPVDWTEGLTESLSVGKARLEGALSWEDNRGRDIVLVGYSLGAMVISDFLEEKSVKQSGSMGPFATYISSETRIVGAILIANPRSDAWPKTRYGIAGAHKPFGRSDVYEITNWNDMISATPHTSILRKLPFFVDYVTGGLKNVDALFWTLASNNVVPTLTDAYMLMGYANNKEHVQAYLNPTGQYAKDFSNAVQLVQPSL